MRYRGSGNSSINFSGTETGILRYNYVTTMAVGGVASLIIRFMGPTLGPSGADRTQVGPMLAPWTLLSGFLRRHIICHIDYMDERFSIFIRWRNSATCTISVARSDRKSKWKFTSRKSYSTRQGSNQLGSICRWYPAKRALPAMLTHGR